MASTNTNTDNQNILSTDIYEITEFLDQVRHDNITDIDNTSSTVGIFGYMNEMFSQTLQNSLVVISENVNETIPTRAKFSKNVINHAMNLGISDIYAKPAVMTMMIYLPITYMEANFTEINETTGKAKFILSRECPIIVGSHEFHLDYDVIFTRTKNPQGKYVYTAIYDLFKTGTTEVKQSNPISDMTNPYITTVMQCTIDRTDFVAFSARLHQVTLTTVSKNILTSSPIENKAVTFDFTGQLAAFDVDVIENGVTTHLTPVYSGLIDYTIQDGSWCYYSFINENTIRVLFSPDSYMPSMNAVVKVNIQTSEGASGNFTYNNNFKISLKSETYNNYNGMYAYIYPLLDGISTTGRDKKSIADIRKIIPREASSRGAIINTSDLNNFFNSINDDECKLYFKKKKDNQFERMYYTYMLMRKDGNVYPTNTLNVRIKQTDFEGFSGNNNLVIKPGAKFYYYDHGTDVDNDFATIIPPSNLIEGLDKEEYPYPMIVNKDGNMVRVFEYTTPFAITIDDDLISSYFLTIMNDNKTFAFDNINTESDLQFIATNMNWKRGYVFNKDNTHEVDNKYTMEVVMTQNNINTDYGLVKHTYDSNGEVIWNKEDVYIRMVMVLYTDETETHPYRYVEAELTDYDPKSFIYTFKFNMGTDDYMDLNNRINITGIYNCGNEELQHKGSIENSHGYMNKNTFAKIFILADLGTNIGTIIENVNGTKTEVTLLNESTVNNRTSIDNVLPTKEDVIDAFLKNNIYYEYTDNGEIIRLNVISIIQGEEEYIKKVQEFNGNESKDETAILRYLRTNRYSDFVQETLLKDPKSISVIENYSFVDLTGYTLCNIMTVDGGIDFYYDYSSMMRSTVTVDQIPLLDSDNTPKCEKFIRFDSNGNEIISYKPLYEVNEDGGYVYNYAIKRIPLIKNDYLNTEELVQDFVYDLETRRKYIEECLYILEDTFDIDFKFFNTYGPSKMFYYSIPSSQEYKVRVITKKLKVFKNTESEEDTNVVGTLSIGDQINITKVKGQWGYITSPYEGWIKLADTTKVTNYIDNVALSMKFALEANTSADKYISDDIVIDVKEYIEDINEINELHIPNIITLITNNYREQLTYFEFLDVNNYGAACQHIYLDEQVSADICPEFLNISTTADGTADITIAVY